MICSQWPGNGVHEKPKPRNRACRGWRSRAWDLRVQISPWIMYIATRWSVNCTSHRQYNLGLFFRRLFTRFKALSSRAACQVFSCNKWGSSWHPNESTSPRPSKRFHTTRSFYRAKFGFSSDPVCSFPAVAGFPLPAKHEPQPRSQKWEASLPAFSSSIFLPIPLFLQLRPCSPPPWSPRSLPHFSRTREDERRSQAPILKPTLGGLLPAPPGFVSYLPSSQSSSSRAI